LTSAQTPAPRLPPRHWRCTISSVRHCTEWALPACGKRSLLSLVMVLAFWAAPIFLCI
jgi:hypothetical protein